MEKDPDFEFTMTGTILNVEGTKAKTELHVLVKGEATAIVEAMIKTMEQDDNFKSIILATVMGYVDPDINKG